MMWNAEKRCYPDCLTCKGRNRRYTSGYSLACFTCADRRIMELEAALKSAQESAVSFYEMFQLAEGDAQKTYQRIAELEAALKPFAEAVREVPDGLYCTLRIWDWPIGEAQGLNVSISATTQHLLEAARILGKIEGNEKPERPIAPTPQPTMPAIPGRKEKTK